MFDAFLCYDCSLFVCCLFFLAVVLVVSFARCVVFVIFVQTNKNLKPATIYKNLHNLQEAAKTCKTTEININTQQMSTQLSNTLAVLKATRPAQRHCGRVAIGPNGVWDKGPALRR